jgi:flagellar hook protein FlgE
MLDTTSNNVANVNTAGYKASHTVFYDTLSQLLADATAAQGGNGGTNPAQIGLGVQTGTIVTDQTQGSPQQTGRTLDVMITGSGYFVVRDNDEQLYTRNGAFGLDGSGRLITASGQVVQGWLAQNGEIDTNKAVSDLRVPINTTIGAMATTAVSFAGNLPANLTPGADTALVRTATVYDAVGNAKDLTLTFTRNASNAAHPQGTWTVLAQTTGQNGTDVTNTVTLDINTDGSLTPSGALALNNNDDVDIAIDLSALTGYSDLTTAEVSEVDGQAAGVLRSIAIGPDGTVIGTFSNGLRQDIAQLALASFNNIDGLEKAGDSTLRATANSGAAQIGVAGNGNRGTLTGSALEMSNVDLSQEFTNMIIAQRGFQANSRVITTSDEILQELVNLKR